MKNFAMERLPSIAELVQTFQISNNSTITAHDHPSRSETFSNYSFKRLEKHAPVEVSKSPPVGEVDFDQHRESRSLEGFIRSYESFVRFMEGYKAGYTYGESKSKFPRNTSIHYIPVETISFHLRQMNLEFEKLKNDCGCDRIAKQKTSKAIQKRKRRRPSSGYEGVVSLKVSEQASILESVPQKGGPNSDLSLKRTRRCSHCGKDDTPEWRRGPSGARTLCNACGLFYSKMNRKYGLAVANNTMQTRKQTGNIQDRRISL